MAGTQPSLAVALVMRPTKTTGLYVMASRRGKLPTPWVWEIRRRDTPLGVKLSGGSFRSEQAALKAGQDALRELLSTWDDRTDK